MADVLIWKPLAPTKDLVSETVERAANIFKEMLFYFSIPEKRSTSTTTEMASADKVEISAGVEINVARLDFEIC